MKINQLFPLAILLSAGWLPALTPNQIAWRQAASKVNGTLNTTGVLAKQSPSSTCDTGKVHVLVNHLERLGERIDALQIAFSEAMQDDALLGDARVAYLNQAGLDLTAISAEYATVRSSIAENYNPGVVLGGDYLISSSTALGNRLNLFLDSYAIQALNGGGGVFWDPCAHQINNGNI